MVWFILAAILAYVLTFFITWSVDGGLDVTEISDSLKTSFYIWGTIVTGILVIIFIILGIAQYFPNIFSGVE